MQVSSNSFVQNKRQVLDYDDIDLSQLRNENYVQKVLDPKLEARRTRPDVIEYCSYWLQITDQLKRYKFVLNLLRTESKRQRHNDEKRINNNTENSMKISGIVAVQEEEEDEKKDKEKMNEMQLQRIMDANEESIAQLCCKYIIKSIYDIECNFGIFNWFSTPSYCCIILFD